MTLLTYNAQANKEDLSDVITNISPYDTPLYSLFGKAKASSTVHEWPEEELRNPKDNAAVEGADYSFDDAHAPVRKQNYTQIFVQGYSVSKTQEAVDKPGQKSNLARSLVLAMRELGTDIEYAYINNTAAVAGNATTARKTGGVQAQIVTNVLDNGGTARQLTEELFNDGMQAAWDAGGRPDTAVVCGKHKRVISGFAANSNRMIDAKDKELVLTVDIYQGDFGRVAIIADRWMPTDRLFILEKERWKTAYLRPPKKEKAPEGMADKVSGVVVAELCLEGRAEKANAIIKDLS